MISWKASKIDENDQSVVTIPDLCLFHSEHARAVQAEADDKVKAEFDAIESKASDGKLWENDDQLESFLSTLETEPTEDNDIILTRDTLFDILNFTRNFFIPGVCQ